MHPAFAGVDVAVGIDVVGEGLRIEGHGSFQIHAVGVGVLLEAGVHRHPGFTGRGDGTAAGAVAELGFNPNV
ncbi:MAG: hypothetical protein L0H70_00110, partial [Xanthomonadales bacterium]|nr:hypothetical protein [Xanthomonadales bacterium]